MAHDIFISYASQDKTVADALCASLENRKIRCWIAPRDVLPGIPYGEAIINGISQSRILVLVFSSNSNNSPQVMREIERAVHKGIPIIPFRIEDVLPTKAMEYFVSAAHWLDAMTPPMEKHLQKLGDTVQVLLSSEPEKEIKPESVTANAPVSRPVQWWKRYKGAPIYGITLVVVVVLVIINLPLLSGGNKAPAGSSPAATTPGGTPSMNTPGSTPASQAAGGPQLLFQDGFTNPESGFKRFSDDAKQISYDNEEYSFTIKKWNYFYWTINEDYGQMENLALEVDGSLFSGSNQGYYGLVFRVQKDTGDFYCFCVSGEGNVIFRKRSSTQWTLLKEWAKPSYVNYGNTVNRIKAVIVDSQCDLYINDNLVSKINEVQSVPGYMGLILITKVAPVCSHFDNFKVYSAGSQVQGK